MVLKFLLSTGQYGKEEVQSDWTLSFGPACHHSESLIRSSLNNLEVSEGSSSALRFEYT